MNGPITVTDANFAADVLRAERPVLLGVWDPRCGPCLELKRHLEGAARQADGCFVVATANVHECRSLPRRLGVSLLPTLVLFVGGAETSRITGLLTRDELSDFVELAMRPSHAERA